MARSEHNEERHPANAARREFLAAVGETKLWELELGLLDEEEATLVRARVEAHPESKQELATIRKAIAAADAQLGAPPPPMEPETPTQASLVDVALGKAKEMLAGIGKDLAAVGAVVLEVGEGLTQLLCLSDEGQPILVPVSGRGSSAQTLGEDTDALGKEAGPPTGARRQEYRTPDGDTVSVVSLRGHKFNVELRRADSTIEGTVHLYRLIGSGEEQRREEILPDQQMTGGRVKFRVPQTGMLEFLCPDGREVPVLILSLEPYGQAGT